MHTYRNASVSDCLRSATHESTLCLEGFRAPATWPAHVREEGRGYGVRNPIWVSLLALQYSIVLLVPLQIAMLANLSVVPVHVVLILICLAFVPYLRRPAAGVCSRYAL